jgi:cell division protein FtsZ
VNQAAAIIKETAHPDVNLIFGAVIDPNIGEELRITVIATGFERPGGMLRADRRARSRSEVQARTARPEPAPGMAEVMPQYDRYDLDIPAFLRNRS